MENSSESNEASSSLTPNIIVSISLAQARLALEPEHGGPVETPIN